MSHTPSRIPRFPRPYFVPAALLALTLGVAPRPSTAAGRAAGAPPVKKAAAAPSPTPSAPSGGAYEDNEFLRDLLGGDGGGYSGGVPVGTVTVGAVGQAAAPPAWVGQFQTAVRAAQSGKKEQATTLFRALVKAQPHLGAAWANLGLLDAQSGQNAAAVTDMKRAIAETKDLQELTAYWAQLTLIYARMRQWADVGTAARKTGEIAPAGSPAATFGTAYLGLALLHQAKYAEALPVLAKRAAIVGEAPQMPDLRYIFALEQTGQFESALATAKTLAKQYAKIPAAANAVRSVGDFAVRNNRYDIALEAYRTTFASHPDDHTLGFNLVAAAVRAGQTNLALQALRGMLTRTPNGPKVNFELGLLLSTGTVDADRLKEAESHLRIAATKDPTNALYITQYGLSVVLQGPTRLAEAISLLTGAVRLDPSSATAHLYLGYAYEQQSQTDKKGAKAHFDQAMKEYETVIALGHRDEHDELARNRRAGILYTENRKDDAYRAWHEFTDLYTNEYSIEALGETASRLFSDHRYAEAERDYTRLTTLLPQDPLAFVGLGQVREQLHDKAGAQAQYAKALQVDPGDATAALALGALLKSEDKRTAAVAVYEKALASIASSRSKLPDAETVDNANRLRLQLGSDYADLGQKDKALATYRALTLRKDDPNESIYQLTAPRFLIAEKRYGEAEQDLTEIARENAADEEVQYELARAQSLNGHGPAAIATLKAIAARYPHEPARRNRAALQIADVEMQIGQYEASATQYEDILRIAPQEPTALAGLSAARTKAGHPEAAGTFLEDAALADPKTPNVDVLHDLQQLYLVMDRTPDRFDAFARKLADHYPNDRGTQLFALSNLLNATEAAKPANRANAQPIVDRLLQANAKDAEALYWRGQLRESEGRRADAVADYTAAVVNDRTNTPAIAALTRLGEPVPKAPELPVKAAPPAAAAVPQPLVPLATGTVPPPAPNAVVTVAAPKTPAPSAAPASTPPVVPPASKP